jgi:hypothetical protein
MAHGSYWQNVTRFQDGPREPRAPYAPRGFRVMTAQDGRSPAEVEREITPDEAIRQGTRCPCHLRWSGGCPDWQAKLAANRPPRESRYRMRTTLA